MRRLGAIGLAVVVAVGLFWMMHALVYLSGGDLAKREDLGGIDFVRLKRQETLQERERRKPEKPPPPPNWRRGWPGATAPNGWPW